MSSDPIREYLKTGNITKRGHLVKNWKMRYFVLTSNELSYFTDSTLKNKKNTIYLDHVGTITASDDLEGYSNLIHLTTDSDEYFLSCENHMERDKWINALEAAHSCNPLVGTSEIVYVRYNQVETPEIINSYYNRFVTNFCEASSFSTHFDSLLNLAAFFARTYNSSTKQVYDYETTQNRCCHILDVVTKKREKSLLNMTWGDDIEPIYIDFLEIITKLKEHIEAAMKCSASSSASSTTSADVKEESGKPKKLFKKIYKLKAQLGQGSYSVVHEAENLETHQRVAVKCITKTKLTAVDLEALKNEVTIMSQLNHPNIVRLEDFYEEDNMYYIVTELADGGELFDKIVEKKCYSETEARDAIRTITEAIAYCHERNIVHRDLKPENILLSSTGELKLADFGFAKSTATKGRLQTDCGSPWYVAPEILEGKLYGTEVDMWSLGVIIYIILSGFPPFHDNNQARLFRKIRSGKFAFLSPYWDNISNEAKELIRHLLVVDPRVRYDARQVLNNKWFTSDSVATTKLVGAQAGLRSFNDTRRKNIIRQGYLIKQGHFIKNWKKRSFVLTAESLSYYTDETAIVPKGTIQLSKIEKVIPGNSENKFILITKGKRYEIQAKNETECDNWKNSIVAARRCWLLIDRAQMALSEGRIRDAIDMIGESRRAEGMILNTTVISLWGKVGVKCERNACAAVLNMNTYRASTALTVNCMTYGCVADKEYILLGSSKGIIQIMTMDGLINSILTCNEETDILSLSLQTSTNLLMSTSRSGTVFFWNFHQKKLLSSIRTPNISVNCCSVSRLKSVAVTGSDDGSVHFYDTSDLKQTAQQCEHKGKVLCIAFNNLSKYVISGGEFGDLIIWNLSNYSREKKLEGHHGSIKSLYVNSADYLLSGGDDKKVILWNLETGTFERELGCQDVKISDDSPLNHKDAVVSVVLSDEFNWGLSADVSGTVILWNVLTGIPEAMCSMSAQLNTIIYPPDGTTFFCGTNIGVEKWIMDWVLTYEGRDYPPPIWLLSHPNKTSTPETPTPPLVIPDIAPESTVPKTTGSNPIVPETTVPIPIVTEPPEPENIPPEPAAPEITTPETAVPPAST